MAIHNDIGTATAGVVSALSGAPDVVEVRDNDQVTAYDDDNVLIITLGVPHPYEWTQDGVMIAYEVFFSNYRKKLTSPATGLTTIPDFNQLSKRALSAMPLAGATTVFGSQIVDPTPQWVDSEFRKGQEVSRFGMLFLSSEPRV